MGGKQILLTFTPGTSTLLHDLHSVRLIDGSLGCVLGVHAYMSTVGYMIKSAFRSTLETLTHILTVARFPTIDIVWTYARESSSIVIDRPQDCFACRDLGFLDLLCVWFPSRALTALEIHLLEVHRVISSTGIH